MTGSEAAARFPTGRLERLVEIDRWHFWFRGRRALLHVVLADALRIPSEILDVGCGSGTTLAWLQERGHRVTGVDGHPRAVAAARRTAPGATVELAPAVALPFDACSFDGVMMLDVLEHVDDDAGALREVRRVVRPRGWVALTVPACPRLWGVRDEDAGHVRRYRADGLRAAVASAGLTLERLTHYQLALLPLVAATRLLGGRRLRDREDLPPPWLNAVLGAVNAVEARVAARVDLPLGSSLVALARRPG